MKSKFLKICSLLALGIILSCGSRNFQNRSMTSVVRAAVDVPDRFEAPANTTLGSNSCKSPLTDPEDGTKIILQTSFGEEGLGDYVVPQGKYGVKSGELLRINCATGEVVGIVKR